MKDNRKFSNEIKVIFDKKGKIVLSSVILLTIVYWFLALWYKNKSGYTKELVVFYLIFGAIFHRYIWLDFWQYIFQFIMTILLFFLFPIIIIRYLFKEDYRDYGLREGKKKTGIILSIPILVSLFFMTMYTSQSPTIYSEYPLSKLIGTNWGIFVFYEFMYFFYFFSYEFIMRGYLQWGLLKKREDDYPEEISWRGIILVLIIQTIITTLFHIGKPIEEILMALVFGPILGYAALKLNSIWYGMTLHFVMNVFLDFWILYWLDMLPI
ncbi:MAG: CPBP family intramembrane glutamic endopeptidase [Promethearchaeota archaeon]